MKLTPSRQCSFEHEAWRVDVEYFDKLQVLKDAFDEHPGEGDEEEVVEEGSDRLTARLTLGPIDPGEHE